MPTVDEIRARVTELRGLYMNATPTQRLGVARSRMTFGASLVNHLVLQVGAVEAFARAVILDLKRRDGLAPEGVYPSIRYLNAEDLITKHVLPSIGRTPSDLFGREDWEKFTLAVEVRNFLVHEAASLALGYVTPLSDSCERVLEALARVAGVTT